MPSADAQTVESLVARFLNGTSVGQVMSLKPSFTEADAVRVLGPPHQAIRDQELGARRLTNLRWTTPFTLGSASFVQTLQLGLQTHPPEDGLFIEVVVTATDVPASTFKQAATQLKKSLGTVLEPRRVKHEFSLGGHSRPTYVAVFAGSAYLKLTSGFEP